MIANEKRYLNAIKKIKLQLENLVDSISPATHIKTVVTLDSGIKVCLTSGYMKPADAIDPHTPIPNYIDDTKITDSNGDTWYYTIISSDGYLLEPINFVNKIPSEWQISKLDIIENPLDAPENTEVVLLDNKWHSITKIVFSEFIDAFIAFKLIN